MSADHLLLHPVAVLLVRYRALVRTAFRAAGLYALLLGVATVFGGDERMMGPSYKSAWDIAESVGASPSVLWGVSVALAGLVALVPTRRVALWGMYAVAAWSALFAISFGLSVNTQPLAGVTGIFGHGFIAVVMTGLIVVRKVDPHV